MSIYGQKQKQYVIYYYNSLGVFRGTKKKITGINYIWYLISSEVPWTVLNEVNSQGLNWQSELDQSNISLFLLLSLSLASKQVFRKLLLPLIIAFCWSSWEISTKANKHTLRTFSYSKKNLLGKIRDLSSVDLTGRSYVFVLLEKRL